MIGQPEQQQEPTTVSMETLKRELDTFFSSRVQPFVDKKTGTMTAKTQQELVNFQQQLDTLKQGGVAITPQQEQALIEKKKADLIAAEGTQASQQQAAPSSPDGKAQQEMDPVSQAAIDLEKKHGIELLDDDPEAKAIDYTNAYTFLQSVEKALEAKKVRTSQDQQKEATLQTPAPVPSGGAPGPFVGRKGSELLSQYFRSADQGRK